MLTLKLITEETDRVIRGLEKKHFKGARGLALTRSAVRPSNSWTRT